MITFIDSFWQLIMDMAPWLLVGFFTAGLVGVLVPFSFISTHLQGRGIWPYIKSTIVGIPMPLCSCSVIPTAMSFYKKGASRGAAVSFLVSTPQTGVDSLFLTSAAFGWPFTIIKVLSAALMGLVGGCFAGSETLKQVKESNYKEIKESKLKKFLKFTFIELPAPLALPFFIGVAINAMVSVAITPGTLGSYLGQGPLVLLGVLLFSIPLYVCATASIPLAILLLDQGLGAGAILVFLIAGPATNTATILMVGQTLGKKGLLAYLGPVIIGSLVIGFFMPNILPEKISSFSHNHSHHSSLNIVCGIILSLILIYPIYKQSKNWLSSKFKETIGERYMLNGLTCQGCVTNAENALISEGYQVLHIDRESLSVKKREASSKSVENTLGELGFEAKQEIN